MEDRQESCCICNWTIRADKPSVKLTEKGSDGINKASEKRKDSIRTSKGQIVHVECRRQYCNPNIINRDKQQEVADQVFRTLRSNKDEFTFKEKCLFCCQFAKACGKKRGCDVFAVTTLSFQEKILERCAERNDIWSNEVRGRIEYAADLPAVEAVYHQTCNVNFRTGKDIPQAFSVEQKKSKQQRGRPSDQEANKAFNEVVEYLKQNEDEQITVTDLVGKMRELCGDKAYSTTHTQQKLKEHFGASLLISEINGKHNVVTLKHTASSILHDFYCRTKTENTEDEKKELIKTAANLIKNDIKSANATRNVYPTPAEIESVEANKRFIPESLTQFLRGIFSEKNADTKICSIGQSIMQASRPRLIMAPLQLGLAVQLHHHYASKFLIDILNSLGFCASYSEVQMFESSAAMSHGTDIDNFQPDMFLQYAADNVDHNIRTLDGHNTFHGMGMIACVTPASKSSKVIPRRNIATEDLLSIGKINISMFLATESKLQIEFSELQSHQIPDSSRKLTFLSKITWPLREPGSEWNGFMQTVRTGEYPGKSSVMFLPIIDMDPTDMSCIYTTLKFLTNHAEKYKQTPVITFDQPLYWKAVKIKFSGNTQCELKHTVLRLGGFHCIMSFLGSIGQLMSGSGLNELLETVYAANSVPHILSGKAVARALRAHFLIDSALSVLLFSKCFDMTPPGDAINVSMCQRNVKETDDCTQDIHDVYLHTKQNITSEHIYEFEDSVHTQLCELVDLHKNIATRVVPVESVNENTLIEVFSKQFKQKQQHLSQYPTAALWLQYMEMVGILRQFLAAERTGNWKLSLQALHNMLPFFAAAGHNLYLKSVYFYLQSMHNLHNSNPDVHKAFESGNHVIRRSERFWAGLSTDLVIEQVLMRSVKTSGGMTRGKGLTECQRAQWLLSMPSCAEINNAMQTFGGIQFHTSPQHKETGKSRKDRDHKDTDIFLSFLKERNPFREDLLLCNIETGVTADQTVNVHRAKELGSMIVKSMVGQNVFEFSFKKRQKAVTLDTAPKIKVDDDAVEIDPQLLFQRLTAAAQRFVDDIPYVFSYEPCSVPSSLFDSSGLMRESQKSTIADSIWTFCECNKCESNTAESNPNYIIDGGSLLQRIPWTKGMIFTDICISYIQYVQRHYANATIVFDGYLSGSSTKDTAHTRRTHGVTGRKVYFTGNTPFQSRKEYFLANSENKQNFIFLLGKSLEEKGYSVLHAACDADLLIVKTALASAERNETIVLGEDTDILVLLLYHANLQHKQILFRSDLKQKAAKGPRVWDILRTKQILGPKTCNIMPVIHAFTGCDTTSRLFGISKGASFKKIRNEEQMVHLSEIFLRQATKEEIIHSGERLIASLYGGLSYESLDFLRFRKFYSKVINSSNYIKVQTLPPTSGAAKYHSMRVYFQVQEWLDKNVKLVPEEWGFVHHQDKLMPVKTDLPAAPDNLLKIIRCNCKQNCDTKRCTCRKHGLDCTTGCGECKGTSCTNTSRLTDTDLNSDI